MIVVSDSSPLISLAKIKQFQLLKQVFSTLFISYDVYNEIVVKDLVLPGSVEVLKADWINKKRIRDKLYAKRLQKTYNLGKGEASTIVLAKEINAKLALIDERRARVVALSEGVEVMGVFGLLELAYKKKLITDLRQTYKQLKEEDVRIDDKLVNDSLKRFGLKEL